ncbi:MAG: type II secretion system protein GspE, partial [Acidobacteria bacterium]
MKSLLGIEIRPLGELLRDRGLISEEDLKNALALQQERREKLGRILIDLGYVAERDVVAILSEQLRMPI